MARLPDKPDLDWKDDGTPVSRVFDDVYFSLSDGLEETRSVFLKPCGLPERWNDRKSFTVAELGFGSGLNFLGLLDLWLNSDRQLDAWLHFVSVEKFLMSAEDAAKVVGRWNGIRAEDLISRWPVRTRGLQRIVFEEFNVTLTLYVGDVREWLISHDFKADAWFLDGFAPAKNDSMWAESVFESIASHSAEGCRIGTYTVAGAVRRGIAAAGFEVSKAEGFGRKRERLEAVWRGSTRTSSEPDIYLTSVRPDRPANVTVIGAGIAGASVARSFAARGVPVRVVDQADGPACGASGNPMALIMPRLDAGDTPQARFLVQSYLFALSFYQVLAPDGIKPVDVDQIAQSENELKRFGKLVVDPPLDESWLSGEVSSDQAVLTHRNAGLIYPKAIVTSLLDHPLISMEYEKSISDINASIERSDKETLFVIAAGQSSKQILSDMRLPLSGKMGQVEFGTISESGNLSAQASGTYAFRDGSDILFGATFEDISDDHTPDVSSAARAENLEGLRKLGPDWVDKLNPETLLSRASVRSTTPDRFPVMGPAFSVSEVSEVLAPIRTGARVIESVPSNPNLFVVTGLGSRGFTFAPLLAETLVSLALDAPSPLARSELELIAPVRFLIRAMRRGQA